MKDSDMKACDMFGPVSGCGLCGDNSQPLHLHASCHMTAPLRAELENGVLTLFCYRPDCNRVVARFILATHPND